MMAIESWLPRNFELADGQIVRLAIQEGIDWQIYESTRGDRILITKSRLFKSWIDLGLLEEGVFSSIEFGGEEYRFFTSPRGVTLSELSACSAPDTVSEALAFAKSFKSTRLIDKESSLTESIYTERYSRLLPTSQVVPQVDDNMVLGFWLTGVRVSIDSERRFRALMGWMSAPDIDQILQASGVYIVDTSRETKPQNSAQRKTSENKFRLIGRPELESFFCEHIIEIVQKPEQYARLGIDFPSAVILHGLPGCGKTFAVERLAEYLDWPYYSIDASSVASPYIHETSRKVAEVFSTAMENAPSMLVIDEMEAFLTEREGSQHHRVEEVAEFLRRIPEAIANKVLVIAMTNRIEMIDTAVTRRGRFDHVIEVKMATASEVSDVLRHLLKDLPCTEDLEITEIADALAERPMSDISFVVREAARLTAKEGSTRISQDQLRQALSSASARNTQKREKSKRTIGFY